MIFLTGVSEAAEEERGFDLGAVDYIIKPFHERVVSARVRTHVSLFRHTSKQKDQMSNLAREAETDNLTTLFNRAGTKRGIEASLRSDEHGTTFDELYRTADVSLYESKRKGKNCFTVYHG